MENLADRKCAPCENGTPSLAAADIARYEKQLSTPWKLVHEEGTDKIRREFAFKTFKEAMDFVNIVAMLAEKEGHHPDMHIWYNKVLLVLWTHAVKGLSENDFIMAEKVNKLAL